MDNLLDAPSGSIAYRDVRAAVAAEIRSVMLNPVVETFRNLCRMTANEIAGFDPLHPSPPGGPLVDPDDFDDSSVDSTTGRRKLRFCTAPKFFYTIGYYKTSTFYREFLLDELVRAPSGRMVSVRDMTEHTSRNPKSSFRSWFRMPLFKVSEIVSHFITDGLIGLTHHCRTNKRLQMKAELLVLGSLAMLGGTI
jgi:hypothetical protein